MLRPVTATLRPNFFAVAIRLCSRKAFEAKVVTMMRLLQPENWRSKLAATVFSDGV